MINRIPTMLGSMTLALAVLTAAAEPQAIVQKGLKVEFTVDGSTTEGAPAAVTEGQYAEVRFRVTDEETGAPVSPLEPAVWVTRTTGTEPMSCRERISGYLQGMLGFQADVDLNKYFILIMNDDRSISVVDPMLGVSGITQLYTMILLEERGEDWARSADDKLMFVSMPKAGKVAVADLDRFRVVQNIDAGTQPTRLALQPDGKYLWVGNDADEAADSGVTVIDARGRKRVGHVATGKGPHRIAFSDDSRRAFVASVDAHTVSVIDVETLGKLAEVEVGSAPLAVDFSALSGAAYVAAADGTLLVLDPAKGDVAARIATGSGLSAFRLDRTGRWGFVANAAESRVDVIDTSSNTIAHRFPVGRLPHQFAFTDSYAYVRHLGTAEVTLVPLAQLSRKDMPGLQKVMFGNAAPGEYPYTAAADAISPTGEWTAVVTSNPVDKLVYYYMEGMIAPMGSYQTYGRVPRAVGVVDRSVRETEKGVYSAKFRVPGSGQYNVSFLLDSPFVDHCFAFEAGPDADLQARRHAGSLRLDFVGEERRVPAGQTLSVRFLLARPDTDEPVSGLRDVTVLATRPPGFWQERRRATALGYGLYEVSFPADEPGVYYVSVAVPSLGIDFTELPHTSFMAVPGGAQSAEGKTKSDGS